jgi:hypothetical protein
MMARRSGLARIASFEDLLGLQVATVGEVDVGLGHRVDVADGVELAQRVAHRGARQAGLGHAVLRVDAPAAAVPPKKESGWMRLLGEGRALARPCPCGRGGLRMRQRAAPSSSARMADRAGQQVRVVLGAATRGRPGSAPAEPGGAAHRR